MESAGHAKFSVQSRAQSRAEVGRAWLQTHLWTLIAVALLGGANAYFLFRPLAPITPTPNSIRLEARGPASTSASGAKDRLIPIGLNENGSTKSSTAIKNSAGELNLSEINIGCDAGISMMLPSSLKQIRLQLSACEKGSKIRAVRNDTNGFEATIFNLDKPSTDYLSLAPGPNLIKIEREGFSQRIAIERTD